MIMEKPNRILALLSEGLSPSQIAIQCKVPTSSVIQQISTAVNEGRVRRSEVLSTLNTEWREWVESFVQNGHKLSPERLCASLKLAFDWDIDIEELKLLFAYIGKPIRAGDMYGLLYEVERTLHTSIKAVLGAKYGFNEAGWWKQGVPEKVRIDCVQARERDLEYTGEPYNFTTLIHLADILEKKWDIFSLRLPTSVAKNKPGFMQNLKRMNNIRNRVMHPVRGMPPTEEEYEFMKEMQRKLELSKWRNS
jgi:hypothetical protein